MGRMHDTELAGHLLEAQAQAGRAGRAGQAVLPKGGLRRHQTDGTWGRLTADRLTTLSKPMTSVDPAQGGNTAGKSSRVKQ